MSLLIKNGLVVAGNSAFPADVLVADGRIAAVGKGLSADGEFDASGCVVCPGLVDMHVHFREPGQEYKETIRTGSMAAAHGGFTLVCPMPNLDPVPDSVENLGVELDIIKRDAVVGVLPYASITKGREGRELVDMKALKPYVAGFSDDGCGVQDAGVMEKAMAMAAECDCLISAHCEDERFPAEDPQSEWSEVVRDARMAVSSGCRFHACHLSSAESVGAIRAARKAGARVSCETAPHYLTLTRSDRKDEGRFKMNPPLRGEEDRKALVEGIKDGTVEVIATDHAPHSAEEKSRGFNGSANGILGLETSFPVMYTRFVRTGDIDIVKLVELMSVNPRRILGVPGGRIEAGADADIAVFNVSEPWKIDSSEFLSKGRSTPFDGMEVYGKCVLTLYKGKKVWIKQ